MMKKTAALKYRYIYPDPAGNSESKFLVCPKCGEFLAPADIESFSSCPYCNTRLEFSNDLEDFILFPLVSHWIRMTGNRRGGNENYHQQ